MRICSALEMDVRVSVRRHFGLIVGSGTRQEARTHRAFETVAKNPNGCFGYFVVVLSSRERFRAATALC